jgi:hypothetical protein
MTEKPLFTDLFVAGKGATFGGGSLAITNMDSMTSVFFIDAFMNLFNNKVMKYLMGNSVSMKILRTLHLAKSPEKIYKEAIRNIVIHENRHCQQINWMLAKGGRELADKIYKKEQKSIYGLGAMERDANRYQDSKKHIPFEEVFKDFLKTT